MLSANDQREAKGLDKRSFRIFQPTAPNARVNQINVALLFVSTPSPFPFRLSGRTLDVRLQVSFAVEL